MKKELIMKIVGGLAISIVTLEAVGIFYIGRKVKKMLRINEAVREERGISHDEFMELREEKLADSDINEFYVLKEKELKGKKMTSEEFAKLSEIEHKLFGEFGNTVVS